MMKRLFIALFAGITILSSASCNKKPAELKWISLVPAKVATAVNKDYRHHKEPSSAPGCKPTKKDFSCYGHYGVQPDATGDSPVAVGLYHDYYKVSGHILGLDTGIGECLERVNCVYRGLLWFDLNQLPSKKVVSAKLKYAQNLDIHSDATKWSANEDCIANLGILESQWGGFDLPADFTGDVSASGTGDGIQVGNIVRKWADGSIENNGFLLIGPKEGIPKNDDDRCVATLNTIRLEVQVNLQ
jgi:hypothetical protein